ncbi:MAG: hypothetical protein JGK17_21765 [Microcoleus sp. PH2017_10_PVI_O_A]|uniref:hypothetical protein n=1 Tax=unclassified Microcoleus TaxID=2642155 RepID=UPI001D50EF2C|nr:MULTISPECIES: hypothetical protein [unclassified Microcoleus]MCC3408164.1 hypothetical protein [Microcoleus sp. PH2017_10_PVI_O_A]MCC3462854.1 hypothetical protein [Microcoleus sp. PH2017_11_PCY_U_A]MCC3480708.1 hypothetical protein [Microcoleus sp. PH2017_12_PCY_D_A]MCC3530634.1 hypothetical protein [Microcoleus sp. PH2017_21_RUC_O_A]MCC3543997.1 hypothetical protein [Microcoleus sp. PH2017_22_RUC_O_B]
MGNGEWGMGTWEWGIGNWELGSYFAFKLCIKNQLNSFVGWALSIATHQQFKGATAYRI